MKKLVEKYCELPQSFRKPLWKLCHHLIQKFDSDQSSVFLNYGYKSKNGLFKNLRLDSVDKPNQYGIQLYEYVTQFQRFEKAEILEVGCGRGGGASWLARNRKLKKI